MDVFFFIFTFLLLFFCHYDLRGVFDCWGVSSISLLWIIEGLKLRFLSSLSTGYSSSN